MKNLIPLLLLLLPLSLFAQHETIYPYLDINAGGETYESGKAFIEADMGFEYQHFVLESNISTLMETRYGLEAGITTEAKPFTHMFMLGVSYGHSYKTIVDETDPKYTIDVEGTRFRPTLSYKWSWGCGDFKLKYIHKTAIQIGVGFQIREMLRL